MAKKLKTIPSLSISVRSHVLLFVGNSYIYVVVTFQDMYNVHGFFLELFFHNLETFDGPVSTPNSSLYLE